MYQLIDTRSGAVVGTYETLRAVSRAADRKDAAYGAVRYTWRRV